MSRAGNDLPRDPQPSGHCPPSILPSTYPPAPPAPPLPSSGSRCSNRRAAHPATSRIACISSSPPPFEPAPARQAQLTGRLSLPYPIVLPPPACHPARMVWHARRSSQGRTMPLGLPNCVVRSVYGEWLRAGARRKELESSSVTCARRARMLGEDEWMTGWVDGCQAIIHPSIHPIIPFGCGPRPR